jgi:hypothetical protein
MFWQFQIFSRVLPPKRGWNKGPDVLEEEKGKIPIEGRVLEPKE